MQKLFNPEAKGTENGSLGLSLSGETKRAQMIKSDDLELKSKPVKISEEQKLVIICVMGPSDLTIAISI